MEECLQYAAADGGGLVGGSKAVGLLAPWVDVAAFHALVDLQATLEQAPETAGEGAAHGFAVYRGGNFTLLNQLSDLHARLKNAVRRGPEDPLAAASADETGDAGVGQGAAGVQRPAQRVAPHGLVLYSLPHDTHCSGSVPDPVP